MPAIYKFFPFYRHHLGKKENDLPALGLLVCFIGCILLAGTVFFFKPQLTAMFLKRSPLFVSYYYTLVPFFIGFTLFTLFEGFAWGTGKMVLSNFLKETLSRLFTTLIILLLLYQLISFSQFMDLFSLLYIIPALVLAWFITRQGDFPVNFKASKVTLRLGGKMAAFSSFIFLSSILGIIARTIDGILIASLKNIADMAVFVIATYFTNLLDIPQRSITSVTVPILAEHWRNKRLDKIASIYKKSSLELMIIGFAIAGSVYLNIPNIIRFLPAGYEAMALPVMILLIAKVLDLGTGVNNQVIGTSSFWKFDFITNVIYTVCAVPLNYFLIKKYGITGAAFANLTAVFIYNLFRFIFIWKKFGMQPFSTKTLWLILVAVVSIAFISFIPQLSNLYLDGLMRTISFLSLFAFLVLYFSISEESLALYKTVVDRIRNFISGK
jgi:O-antigen/teichoic acid export membrane protein